MHLVLFCFYCAILSWSLVYFLAQAEYSVSYRIVTSVSVGESANQKCIDLCLTTMNRVIVSFPYFCPRRLP